MLDAETLRLDDGSELRLAGIVAPRASDTASDTVFWPPASEARRALETAVAGRPIEIASASGKADRYGRLVGQAFVIESGRRIWLQALQLAAGHARVHALADRTACLDELLGHERLAQSAGLGLWANAAYQVRPATDTNALMRYRHTLQLVEGQVVEVAELRGRVYLNFGSDWRSDFTAGIERPRGEGWPRDMRELKAKFVRVRGFIERRNGPYVELAHPSQLELLLDPAPAVAAADPASPGRSRSRRRAATQTAPAQVTSP